MFEAFWSIILFSQFVRHALKTLGALHTQSKVIPVPIAEPWSVRQLDTSNALIESINPVSGSEWSEPWSEVIIKYHEKYYKSWKRLNNLNIVHYLSSFRDSVIFKAGIRVELRRKVHDCTCSHMVFTCVYNHCNKTLFSVGEQCAWIKSRHNTSQYHNTKMKDLNGSEWIWMNLNGASCSPVPIQQ